MILFINILTYYVFSIKFSATVTKIKIFVKIYFNNYQNLNKILIILKVPATLSKQLLNIPEIYLYIKLIFEPIMQLNFMQ